MERGLRKEREHGDGHARYMSLSEARCFESLVCSLWVGKETLYLSILGDIGRGVKEGMGVHTIIHSLRCTLRGIRKR